MKYLKIMAILLIMGLTACTSMIQEPIQKPSQKKLLVSILEALIKEIQINEENFQGRYQGIGIQFDIIESFITVITPIPGSPSEKVGLMAGDKIIEINGESAVGMSQNDVPKKLKGPKGTSVDM